jgi:hypothetical protein
MSRLRPSLGPAAVILGFTLMLSCGVMVPRVDAGIGGQSTIVMPETAVVGVTFTATMTIRNQSTPGQDTENVQVISALITPSCADVALAICFPPNLDPGVFDLLSAAGNPSTAPCAGTSFQIGMVDPASGAIRLIPNQTITLGPSNGPLAARTCQIDLLFVAKKLPENPVFGTTGETWTLGQTVLEGLVSRLKGPTSSSSLVTVVAAPPSPPTAVPTLSEWVMIVLAGFLILVAAIGLRKRTT